MLPGPGTPGLPGTPSLPGTPGLPMTPGAPRTPGLTPRTPGLAWPAAARMPVIPPRTPRFEPGSLATQSVWMPLRLPTPLHLPSTRPVAPPNPPPPPRSDVFGSDSSSDEESEDTAAEAAPEAAEPHVESLEPLADRVWHRVEMLIKDLDSYLAVFPRESTYQNMEVLGPGYHSYNAFRSLFQSYLGTWAIWVPVVFLIVFWFLQPSYSWVSRQPTVGHICIL